MELTPEMIEQLKADLKKAKTYQDLMGEGRSHQENHKSFLRRNA